MVFIDKGTAEIIAKRIEHAVSALIRSAVDESMTGGALGATKNAREKEQSARQETH
jgi:Mn-dependent DtxR family transcriptional regulator